MADGVSIAVDSAGLASALDALPRAIQTASKGVAMDTGRRVRDETVGRLHRAWHGTGRTAELIEVADHLPGVPGDQDAVFVYQRGTADRSQNVLLWLEFGTIHMRGQPSLWPSVQLEQGGHRRRLEEAVQKVIDG